MSENNSLMALAGKRDASVEVASSRSAQEVQAMVVLGKRFPRDEEAAYARIMQACARKGLAEDATYEYTRGGQKIDGPSIRLAEVMARAWGNIDAGIIELEQRNGESTMLAYAWDIETNTRVSRTFQVKHERHTKQGVKRLEDPRDIYEMTANQGSRRLRACILQIIPGDIVDAALETCAKTLTSGHTEPIQDRARKMLVAFQAFGITQEMIEKRIGHKLSAVTETELARLRKVFTSLKDGMGSREDFFEVVSVVRSGMDALQKNSEGAQTVSAPAAPDPDLPSDDENARRIELAEALAAKWESEGATRAARIVRLRNAASALNFEGLAIPEGEGGMPALDEIPSVVLEQCLAGEE